MKNLLNNPEFKDLVAKGKSDHEVNIEIGFLIKAQFPRPLIQFPETPKEALVKVLVATCVTEKEVEEVLSAAGLGAALVSIMAEPKNEAEREAQALCIAMGADLTREGLPCMVMFFEDYFSLHLKE